MHRCSPQDTQGKVGECLCTDTDPRATISFKTTLIVTWDCDVETVFNWETRFAWSDPSQRFAFAVIVKPLLALPTEQISFNLLRGCLYGPLRHNHRVGIVKSRRSCSFHRLAGKKMAAH
jgi:hypothetical protein